MTFHEAIRRRLIALASVKGLALSALARAMGRSPSHMIRKLNPPEGGEARLLSTQDVDEALVAMGEPWIRLMAEVVSPADQAILSWIAACGEAPSTSDARRFMRSAEKVLRRLLLQELIEVRGGHLLYLTPAGERIARPTGPQAHHAPDSGHSTRPLTLDP